MTKEKETNGYLIFIENNCVYKYNFQTIGMVEWGIDRPAKKHK